MHTAQLHSDLESIEIEDDYDGPKLEDGKVTEKFMVDLMEYYKNQKKLHRKFAYKVLSHIHLGIFHDTVMKKF